MPNPINVNGHKSQLSKCVCHFVKQTEWMLKSGIKLQG